MAAHVGEPEMPIDLSLRVRRAAPGRGAVPRRVLCDLTDAHDKLLPKLYKRRPSWTFGTSKANKRDILNAATALLPAHPS